jgi:hypothetical protein
MHSLRNSPIRGFYVSIGQNTSDMPLGRGIPPLSVILVFGAFKITIEPKTIIKDILKIVFFAILIINRINYIMGYL